jgi:peptidoglycan/xylan/chitin deacetylase (PgdA/CDA1 family)
MGRDILSLCYHAVSETWPADLSISPRQLEEQLRRKLRAGYTPATLSESRAAGRTGKTLVVTFDDGYLSNLTLAAPILARLGVPGTLFVPSDYVSGGPMEWPGIERWRRGPHERELTPLDWEQVAELAGMGWEIGSHTCSHPKLTTLADDQLERELRDSRAAIEARLRAPCRTIAYPYGDVDDRVVASARNAGYELGVTLPISWPDESDPLRLPRVGIYNGKGTISYGIKTSRAVRRLRRFAGR